MNKTISILGLATVLALGMAATATAFPAGHGSHHHRFERIAENLDMDDQQRQQLKQIYRKARPQMLEVKDAMQDNREALRKLDPKSAQFDQQVSELAGQQGELITQKIIQYHQMRASIFAILTPKQREIARKMKPGHFRKHGECGRRQGRTGR